MTNRTKIKSGDLLAWSTDKKSLLSKVFLELIRILTSSEYAHVAIAWWIDGRLFIVEATTPNVRLIPIADTDEFYHIPAEIEWSEKAENYLLDKIGLPYSFIDGVLAYLGKTLPESTHYQCAELANDFYRQMGLELGPTNNTPAKVVNALSIAKETYVEYIGPVVQA